MRVPQLDDGAIFEAGGFGHCARSSSNSAWS